MDNDNPLLQKAADLYRGLRFTMKYRGVDILPAAAGNDLARDLLESGQPFLFGRCGATEMRTVADWLQNGGHNFTDRTRADIRNLSGVFPTDDATLDKFCRLYVKTAQSAELLALWVLFPCNVGILQQLHVEGSRFHRDLRDRQQSKNRFYARQVRVDSVFNRRSKPAFALGADAVVEPRCAVARFAVAARLP